MCTTHKRRRGPGPAIEHGGSMPIVRDLIQSHPQIIHINIFLHIKNKQCHKSNGFFVCLQTQENVLTDKYS